MAQELYVVIEFDRETHEFSEIEAIYRSKEEAENLVKEYNAKFLRYSYEWFEETYHDEEVDAVFAKKDAEIGESEERIDELQKAADSAWSKVNAMYDELRHQKYKRCLAMAEKCEERYKYLTCLENWQMTNKEFQQVIGDYWDRWYKRWMELAEKFKEGT